MNLFLVHNMRGVVLISLFLLASAQRTSNSLKDVDFQELARQNRITKQILEAYLQKKLGRGSVKPPSISDILPVKKSEDVAEKEEGEAPLEQDYIEDDSLQSVESEQIDSIYANEGRSRKYLNPAFESDVETNSILQSQPLLSKDMLDYLSLLTKTLYLPANNSTSKQENDKVINNNTTFKRNHDVELTKECTSCNDDELGVTRWTMPLHKSGEKKYYLGIFFKANWFKAQQYCRFHGMHLASVSSQEENDRLEKYVKDSGYGREHFWTSGTDLAEEGNFFWMANGRPLTFVNWNAGEPNNFRYENGEEENCLELWNRDDKGLKWNDSPCSFETYFICEVRSD